MNRNSETPARTNAFELIIDGLLSGERTHDEGAQEMFAQSVVRFIDEAQRDPAHAVWVISGLVDVIDMYATTYADQDLSETIEFMYKLKALEAEQKITYEE